MTEPIDDEGFMKSVIEKARRDFQEGARIAEETKRAALQMWKQLAGESLDMMLRERSSAEGYLFDPSPKLRLTALWVLSDYWGLSEKNASQCERMAAEDTDNEVASVAVTCLGEYYAKSDDRRIGRLLATFIKNDTRAPQIRAISYNALLKLRGLPISNWSHQFMNPSYYSNFDQEVDFAFVDSYLKSP